MIHELKTWPIYFAAVAEGNKTFEFRVNDRSFQVGDTLHLREFDPETEEYTGNELLKEVTYILVIPPLEKVSYVILALGT